jgi:hypothetical protein
MPPPSNRCFLLLSSCRLLAWLIVKMEAIRSSETTANLYLPTQRHISEDNKLTVTAERTSILIRLLS